KSINNKTQILQCFKRILKKEKLKKEDVLVVAERTGIYTNPLLWSLVEEGYNLWIECPNQIHASKGFSRGKNDKKDARMIAEYGYRHQDKVKLCQLTDDNLVSLQYLQSERELLKREEAKFKSQITDHKGYVSEKDYSSRKKRYTSILTTIKESLQEIEKEINTIIKGDTKLKHIMKLLLSVRGVGQVIATDVLISTQAFTKFTTARAYCSHVGVAPFQYTSGSSIRSRNKVSKRANKRIKRNLHMGVNSVIQAGGNFEKYYNRKLKEGKEKMVVINALRAKLIHIMFSVVQNNRKYSEEHVATWT
ncbi:transposase, partial [Flammeovirga aprica]|uniref:transposase n=1 Tax=Flammeovirga aprica TaxID=29528 RepID=UPI00197DEFF7